MEQGPCQPYLSPCPGGLEQCPAHVKPSIFCWLLNNHGTWKIVEHIVNRGERNLHVIFLVACDQHKIRFGERANFLSTVASSFTKWSNHKSYTEIFFCCASFHSAYRLELIDFNYKSITTSDSPQIPWLCRSQNPSQKHLHWSGCVLNHFHRNKEFLAEAS